MKVGFDYFILQKGFLALGFSGEMVLLGYFPFCVLIMTSNDWNRYLGRVNDWVEWLRLKRKLFSGRCCRKLKALRFRKWGFCVSKLTQIWIFAKGNFLKFIHSAFRMLHCDLWEVLNYLPVHYNKMQIWCIRAHQYIVYLNYFCVFLMAT